MSNKLIKKGFTLIELLVVVLIIGILAAVAMPQYQRAAIKSRYATVKILVKSIADTEEIYFLANDRYADTFDKLDIGMPEGKKDNSTENIYRYPWGFCIIAQTDPDAGTTYAPTVKCTQEEANIGYQIYLKDGHPSWRGKTFCLPHISRELGPLQHQICKQETGHEPLSDGMMYLY